MISKELQNTCREKFNGPNRIVFIAEGDDRLAAFHRALPHFIPAQGNLYIGTNNTIWKMVIVTPELVFTKHAGEAVVDATLSEELFTKKVLPACEMRCVRMEFFE